MIYKIGDICTITKGTTGIMKAIPGNYPLVALSNERKSHNEFQFDAKAVIVPLISSTGHGHASMKRVHYQEGKFALGNILCAVIPKNDSQLNPKYLHLYLQQFKESLLVPLMKGAANVSLSLNKLSSVEIVLPSIERQMEIIALEENIAPLKNDLEIKLSSQEFNVNNLRLAYLNEAMLGKLVPQDPNDEPVNELLKRIKEEKEKLIKEKKIKKENALPPIDENEIPYEIPKNWIWCRLGDIIEIQMGQSPDGNSYNKNGLGLPFYQGKKDFGKMYPTGVTIWCDQPKRISEPKDILISVRAPVGDVNISDKNYSIGRGLSIIRILNNTLDHFFMFYYFESIKRKWKVRGSFFDSINRNIIVERLVPIPSFQEQQRIVTKINQINTIIDDFEKCIVRSKMQTEQLLYVALKEALIAKVS